MRRLLRALTLLLAALALATASTSAAFAQGEGEDAGPLVVLLKVPGGGTKLLADTLYEVEPIVLRPESWFVKQAKRRGFSKARTLKKAKSMRWVMKGAKIDVVVRLREKGDAYRVDFYGPESGKSEQDFKVPRGDDGLTVEGAEEIRTQLVSRFEGRVRVKGQAAPDPDPPAEDGPVDDPVDDPADDPVEDPVDDPVVAPRPAGDAQAPGDYLWVYGGARLIKRDLLVGGQNSTVFSYISVFYPGYEVAAEFFPLVFTDQDFTALGLYVDFYQGFDGFSAIAPDGSQVRLNLTHLHAEGGLSYRIDTPRDVAMSGDYVRIRLRATVRHDNFGVEENASVPSTSQTAVVLSGNVAYPLLVDGFSLTGSFEIVPVSFWGAGLDQFGTSAFTYGMGTSLGGLFSVGNGINVSFGYAFGLYRTDFEGAGVALFENANAFELIQGLNAGLSFQM